MLPWNWGSHLWWFSEVLPKHQIPRWRSQSGNPVLRETLACSRAPWWFYWCRLCAASRQKHPNVCPQESQGKRKLEPTGKDAKYWLPVRFHWNSLEWKWKIKRHHGENSCLSYLNPKKNNVTLRKFIKSFLCVFLIELLTLFRWVTF